MAKFTHPSAALALSLSIGFGVVVSCVSAQPAGARERTVSGKTVTFTACSRYGNGCVSSRVRRAALGAQVQLRSGTWIYCRGDCRQTLLEETVDFWDSQNEKAQIAVP
jgi:hypothetical protein